ncbi:restriction endonuclease [Lysobacter panacisoli]|uniref:Restriction endonuclease n=1 Tax=Lysobacter panacisoli TaxID=1255263 RepID=A0ABP9LB06_9GAMM|nr:restriction endonuclease [Lysobacter panacisoli]
MPDGFSLTIALLVTVFAGALATTYLWLVRQRQAETAAGITALAEMRWREFARLVVEALQVRGFEAESLDQSLDQGPQAEIRLRREGRTWLLVSKLAGARSRLASANIRELADAVRFQNAAGGVLATPARIDADARKSAGALELYDGESLWSLVGPMLPQALHDDLTANARKRGAKETAIVWGGAIVLGLLLGLVPALLPEGDTGSEAVSAAPAAPVPAPRPASVAPAAAEPALGVAAPADPNRDQFERGEVINAVAALPWVERVLWSTSSTLVVQQREDVDHAQIQEICGVLRRYDTLRASRLQLQPPAGSDRKVRFLQCQAY